MRRITLDPAPATWAELGRLFGLTCDSRNSFERECLEIDEPLLVSAVNRKQLDGNMQDALESVQQKSDKVYVVWGK